MRKIIIYFMCYMLICFLIPYFFTVRKPEEETKIIDSSPEKIKLLLTEKNEVVELSLNDYLKGVLIGEVPVKYEIEALKAQAIVARTYTLHKLNSGVTHENADMCDDINHCQAYKTKEYAFASWDDNEENEKWAKMERAVEETSGKYITYNGEIINAFFHAHSGGKTEDANYIWGRESIPYLKSVDGNENYLFNEEKVFSNKDFINMIKSKYPNYDEKLECEITSRTISNRADNLKVGNITMLATELRTLLGLRSTNFEIEKRENEIVFKTIGYGHGIGMSQEGANQMAIERKKL